MMADGYIIGDGSWTLRVYVTDLQVERSLRVKGDLHIGGVMLSLVQDLGKYTSFYHTRNKYDHNFIICLYKHEFRLISGLKRLERGILDFCE